VTTPEQTPPAGPAHAIPSIYRYRIGDIEITAVHDGSRAVPLGQGFIPDTPLAEVQNALKEAYLPTDHLTLTFTPLVVKTGPNLAVIDTGFADNGPPTAGNFFRDLPAAGVDPKKVDTVVISHFHGDHISGLRLKDGSDPYPSARIMVPAAEWAYWLDDARMSQAPEGLRGTFALARQVLGPLGDRVVKFEAGAEILPGITAIDTPGHTPGHSSFAVASGEARLLITSDITNHPALFVRHPDWAPAFDMDPDQARATRRRMLDMAANERMQVAMFHAPFPATGYIARAGDGFRFVPVQWNPDTPG
jgi:glyoxylase-like metal-dependent hydrolase (beta-lactamase superfamily II)